jgi:L-seryl-tRNA(Ser) seleniumtransferase
MSSPALRSLPRVDRVIAHPSLEALRRRLGAEALTRLTRRVIETARIAAKSGGNCPTVEEAAAEVARAARAALSKRARPVINATGVVLHTNLGRAPLAQAAVRALAESAGRYTSIEIDLEAGRRGARGAFADSALAELSGAEAALVVNNNAAAVLLALSALAMGKRVIVSRGELVEIGGGFRIPEVLARSGARLVEVGTTNRTRLDDYARALDASDEGGAAAILRVHQANFRQIGFVERPGLQAIAGLARERGALLIKDLGGGAMLDLGPHGLEGEPMVRESVRAGCDVVCFSTDKVLGGPQGGAIVGRAELIERARRDPLARALRLGRLPLVALEATLACYMEGDLNAIPALAAVRAPLSEIARRAEAWQAALAERGVASEVVKLAAAMGGGSLAEESLASAGLAVSAAAPRDVEAIARRLRTGDPPVLGRIHEGRLLLDARTVLPGEDEALIDAVVAAMPQAVADDGDADRRDDSL